MRRENLYPREEYIRKIENKELSLIELAKFVLVKWKLVMILCVIFFGGWILTDVIMNSRINNDLPPASEQESTEEQQIELTEDQQKKIHDIIKQKEEVEKLENYRNTLAYMSIDPYTCNVNILQYLISGDGLGGEIYEAYRTYAGTGGLKKVVDENLGEEIANPSDLVSVISNQLQVEKQEFFKDRKSYVLILKIVTTDANMNNEITDVVKDALEKYHKYLSSVMGKHDLIMLSESSYWGSDSDIKQAQSELISEIEEKKARINNNESILDDNEKEFLEQLKNNNSYNNNEEEVVIPVEKQGKSIIWYILVLVICGGISCLIVSCYYLFVFGSRLKSGEEIMSIFDLPYIGDISKKDLETSVFSMKDEIESVCLEIKEKNIFISVMSNVSNIKESFNTIKDKLEQNNLVITFGGNISENNESLKMARLSKNIVLVFEEGKTTYSSVDSVLQRCNNWGINIIGVINISK